MDERAQWQGRMRLVCLFLALAVIGMLGGCTRGFYRRQADKEVADILQEKDKYPDWKIEQFHVYPDPRARFANPNNPDRQPMPPDDEAAWQQSPHPQRPKHAGVASTESTTYLEIIKAWDAENRATRVGKEDATEQAPWAGRADSKSAAGSGSIQSIFDALASQQGFLLTLGQTVELGLINSPDYQTAREDLYLTALPVTQQRFSFVWQWAATENAIREWAGPKSLVGQRNNWNLGSSVSAGKLLSTGALLTMSFANSTVFNFLSGANGLTSASTININAVQPLLQGGGKAVTLEPLTQAERNLFYTIRAYARYREQFFTAIAYGATTPSSLAAAAGISAGGGSPISLLASLGIASTDVAGQFRGYLPSLYRAVDLAVDRKYVYELEKALRLYEGFQEGGQVAPLQVDQVRSTLLNARNTVLKDMQDSANALDQFKLQLGLPANIPLVLDDEPARPITRVLDRYYQVLDESDATYKVVEEQDQLEPAKFRPFLLKVFTTNALVRGTRFQTRITGSWDTWAKASDADIKARLESLMQIRRKLLDAKTDLEMQGKGLTTEDMDRLALAEFESDLGGLEQTLRRYEARPWEKIAKVEMRRQARIKLFRETSYAAEIVLVWPRNERFELVGQMWPELPRANVDGLELLNTNVDVAQQGAIQAALANRYDLMNARALVVDAWRQLAVTANALLGVLNVAYHLDATTPPGGATPLAFSTAATHQELIINAALPLARVAERNAYRTALIRYERARRALLNSEDSIAAQVRFDVRQLHLFAENYRIQKKVVESLYSQVENALEVIVAPVDPDQLKASGTAGQANAAALTQQYLNVLGQLNNAQTKMYDIWLSYLATRMQLYQDLERLPLDSRGVWTDEFGYHAAVTSPPTAGVVTLQQPEQARSPANAAGATPLADPGAGRGAVLGQPIPGPEREPAQSPAGARLLAPSQTPRLD